MEKLDIKSGDKFNKWTIIEEVKSYIYPSGKSRRRFLVKCDCGTIKENNINTIKNNVSCGCFHSEQLSNRNRTHNLSTHPLFRTWCDMKKRCRQKEGTKNWNWYGKYGIKVCDRWINSFENFLNDMGNKPSKEYSIDRINVYGNYEPNNCRWATPSQQNENKRK